METDNTSPPRKKTKIDDFFGGKAKNGKDKTSKDDEVDEDDAKTDEPDDIDKTGTSSGYQRDDEQSTSAGQSSDYVRDDEPNQSALDTDEPCPPSPEDIRENIKTKFLMEMPEDFYDLWELATTINKANPSVAFKPSLGLELVGPYDILAGRHKLVKGKSPCYLRHWRYYYDPPELMTILRGDDKTQFHMGYFRDDPHQLPDFVASNAAKDSCTITRRGDNIFAAMIWFIEDKMKKENMKDGKLGKLKQQLTDSAKASGYCLDVRSSAMKARDKKVVCRTFHGAGMVVPMENDVGYREVPETPADLKKMFKKILEAKTDDERNKAMDPLMEITMLVQFANDECDYGEGLELGLDLFSYGGEVFHKLILNLLPLAYQLLDRMEYADIIKSHLADRRHTTNLSVLSS